MARRRGLHGALGLGAWGKRGKEKGISQSAQDRVSDLYLQHTACLDKVWTLLVRMSQLGGIRARINAPLSSLEMQWD